MDGLASLISQLSQNAPEASASSSDEAPTHLVRAASTANLSSLTSVSTTFDGLTLVAGDRVLLKDQTTASQNGIYVVGTVSSGNAPLTRAADMPAGSSVIPQTLIGVAAGTANGGKVFANTNTAARKVGTDTMTFGAAISTSLSSTTPAALSQTAGAVGSGTTAAKADHTHAVLGDAAGTALTNADATVQVSGGFWYTLPASTLSANHTCTLSTTGAAAGHMITITRLDASANTYAIIDGGTGTPTLITLPVSKKGFAVCQFDGTNWQLKSFASF